MSLLTEYGGRLANMPILELVRSWQAFAWGN